MTRNIVAIGLSLIVLIATIFTVAAIWDLWELPRDAIMKLLKTLFVVMCSGGVTLFIFSVIYKSKKSNERERVEQHTNSKSEQTAA